MSEQPNTEKAKRTFSEEVEVAGNQAVSKVQELIKQGNVRRLIIRRANKKSKSRLMRNNISTSTVMKNTPPNEGVFFYG